MNVSNQALMAISIWTLNTGKAMKSGSIHTINDVRKLNWFNSHFEINARIKQTYALLSALLFMIGMMLYPTGQVVAQITGEGVKWHPGHYYTILDHGKNQSWYMSQVYNELKSTPALLGVQVRYRWKELEPREGVYNFAPIDKHLSELAKRNKRLVILLEIKSWGTDAASAPVPDYAKTTLYEGGMFAFTDHGKNIVVGYGTKLWNTRIHDRWVALVRELGKRYNLHSHFEGIGITETSMGETKEILSNEQIYDYYKNLLSINQQLRAHFPNTVTYQFVNYPRPILQSFVGKLKEMGAALGGPDIFIEDPGLLYPNAPKGIYNYYPDLSGTVPLAPSVQHQNYRATQWGGASYEPSVSELLAFGRDKLKANYIFWTRDPDYQWKVRELLNKSQQKNMPAGGLNVACPTAYVACIN